MKMLKVLANLEDQKSKQGFIWKQNVLFVDKSAVLNTENVQSWRLHQITWLIYTKGWQWVAYKNMWRYPAMPQSQSRPATKEQPWNGQLKNYYGA